MTPTRARWALLAMLAAIIVACSAPAGPAPAGTDVGTAGADSPVAPHAEKRVVYATLLPPDVRPTASRGSRQWVLPLIASGLTTGDGTGGRRPLLALEVPNLDDGSWQLHPDGTMITTFELRPGAQWHDGAPITADDFLFSLEVGRDRAMAPAFDNAGYASIAAVSVAGPLTLVISWKEPYIAADALFSWDQGYGAPLPRHLLEREYAANKAGLLDLTYWG